LAERLSAKWIVVRDIFGIAGATVFTGGAEVLTGGADHRLDQRQNSFPIQRSEKMRE